MSTYKKSQHLKFEGIFRSEKYRVFTQHAAVAIWRHSATMGQSILDPLHHCLGLGHEIMVWVVCLSIFLCDDIDIGHHWFTIFMPNGTKPLPETNDDLLSITLLGTNFREILINMQSISLNKMYFKMSLAKWRPFRLNVLNHMWTHLLKMFIVTSYIGPLLSRILHDIIQGMLL